METKLSQLKAAYAAGDYHAALRIAAKFPRLDDAKEVITRAWNCIQSPDIYREMGWDVDATVAAGVEALKTRYGL